MTYSETWDLESIFPGGSQSPKLAEKLTILKSQILDYSTAVATWNVENDKPTFSTFTSLIHQQDVISDGIGQTFSFISCIQAADTEDRKAPTIQAAIQELSTQFETTSGVFSKKVSKVDDATWELISQTPVMKEHGVAFNLNERRRDGKELLSDREEEIINQLSLDGLNAWSANYDTIVGLMTIPFEENGKKTDLSVGQAFNRMMSSPDKATRDALFTSWESTWEKQAPLFANTLNHLDGFRLTNYRLHDTTDFLKAPLEYNRMSKATLDSMWSAVANNKQPFVDFLTRKANLFGTEKMAWQDQDAPILLDGYEERRFTFDEAADFIVENFQKFSPKMAEFAKMAFENRWIEAEDRPGKRPGGFCTGFPELGESRIFMTFGGSINEVATMAHELGHAFHSYVIRDLPSMSQDYAMNVAETASTLAELIVADATLKTAQSPQETINLLDVKMQNAIAMFMNIHARFIFETNFYSARQKGVLTAEEITNLMVDAQKESYKNELANYHPHFWASKLHFYMDDVPFYNFPYTFGYLFSMGIYSYAKEKGGSFEDDYIALLRDTASMTTEELAMKHLGVDLTKPDFWQAGIDTVIKDVNQFMDVTSSFIK